MMIMTMIVIIKKKKKKKNSVPNLTVNQWGIVDVQIVFPLK
jgi:hypothetical protein